MIMHVDYKLIYFLSSWKISKDRILHFGLKGLDPLDFAFSTFILEFIEYFLDPLVNINLMKSDCSFLALSSLSKHLWHQWMQFKHILVSLDLLEPSIVLFYLFIVLLIRLGKCINVMAFDKQLLLFEKELEFIFHLELI